jgi:hypothetical protein
VLRLHVVPCVVLHADLQEWRDGLLSLLIDCRSRGQELDLEGTIRLILLHNVLESWRFHGNNRVPSYQLLDGRIPFGEYVVLLQQGKRLLIYRPKSPCSGEVGYMYNNVHQSFHDGPDQPHRAVAERTVLSSVLPLVPGVLSNPFVPF